MKRVDTRDSRIETLKKTQESRKQDCLERVYKAIERLQKIGAKINFHTVAKEANLSVSYLYKYPELKQHVAQLRSQQSSIPISPVAKPASSSHAKIVSRFKERIYQLEAQNQELRRKNEALAGQVYRVHHLQAQVERQQQTIEDLQARINAAHEQKSVAKVTPISSKKKAKVSDQIEEELEALGIPLNTTLTKTIKSASEELVLNAIEALKEAMANGDIPRPGGWLNKAIQEGWAKNEPQLQQTSNYNPLVYMTSEKSEEELIDLKQLKELLQELK
jgi:cysteinyl-tRNA synthetase